MKRVGHTTNVLHGIYKGKIITWIKIFFNQCQLLFQLLTITTSNRSRNQYNFKQVYILKIQSFDNYKQQSLNQ